MAESVGGVQLEVELTYDKALSELESFAKKAETSIKGSLPDMGSQLAGLRQVSNELKTTMLGMQNLRNEAELLAQSQNNAAKVQLESIDSVTKARERQVAADVSFRKAQEKSLSDSLSREFAAVAKTIAEERALRERQISIDAAFREAQTKAAEKSAQEQVRLAQKAAADEAAARERQLQVDSAFRQAQQELLTKSLNAELEAMAKAAAKERELREVQIRADAVFRQEQEKMAAAAAGAFTKAEAGVNGYLASLKQAAAVAGKSAEEQARLRVEMMGGSKAAQEEAAALIREAEAAKLAAHQTTTWAEANSLARVEVVRLTREFLRGDFTRMVSSYSVLAGAVGGAAIAVQFLADTIISAFTSPLAIMLEVAAAVGYLAYRVASLGTELQDLHTQTGVTVEEWSSLKQVADASGSNIEDFSKSVEHLYTALSKSKEHGSLTEKALSAIGLSIEKLKNLAPKDQLLGIAEAMEKYKDGANKAAVETALFGSNSAELTEALHKMAKDGLPAATITADMAESASSARKSLREFKSEALAFFDQVGVGIVKVGAFAAIGLKTILAGIVGVWDVSAALLEAGVRGVVAMIGEVFANAADKAAKFFVAASVIADALPEKFRSDAMQQGLARTAVGFSRLAAGIRDVSGASGRLGLDGVASTLETKVKGAVDRTTSSVMKLGKEMDDIIHPKAAKAGAALPDVGRISDQLQKKKLSSESLKDEQLALSMAKEQVKEAEDQLRIKKQVHELTSQQDYSDILSAKLAEAKAQYQLDEATRARALIKAKRDGDKDTAKNLEDQESQLKRQYELKVRGLKVDEAARQLAEKYTESQTQINVVLAARQTIMQSMANLFGQATDAQKSELIETSKAATIQKAMYEQALANEALRNAPSWQRTLDLEARRLKLASDLYDLEKERMQLLEQNAVTAHDIAAGMVNELTIQINELNKAKTSWIHDVVQGGTKGIQQASSNVAGFITGGKSTFSISDDIIKPMREAVRSAIADSMAKSLTSGILQSLKSMFQIDLADPQQKALDVAAKMLDTQTNMNNALAGINTKLEGPLQVVMATAASSSSAAIAENAKNAAKESDAIESLKGAAESIKTSSGDMKDSADASKSSTDAMGGIVDSLGSWASSLFSGLGSLLSSMMGSGGGGTAGGTSGYMGMAQSLMKSVGGMFGGGSSTPSMGTGMTGGLDSQDYNMQGWQNAGSASSSGMSGMSGMFGGGNGSFGGAGYGVLGSIFGSLVANKGHKAGAASGAAMGAQLGSYFGPWGAAIGAVLGALAGGAARGETRSGGQYGYGTTPFNNYGTSGVTFIQGPSGGQIEGDKVQSAVMSTIQNINDQLKKLGSTATISGFQAALESSDKGRGGVYAGGTLSTGATFGLPGLGGGRSNYSGTLYDPTKSTSPDAKGAAEAFALELKQATIQALKAANVGGIVGYYLNSVQEISKLTSEQTDAMMTQINALEQFNDVLKTMPFSNLAKASADAQLALIDLMGGAETAASSISDYVKNYYNDADQMKALQSQVNALFGELNQTTPTTKEQFKALVEAQDLTTESGREMYAALMNIQGPFAQFIDAQEAAAKATKDAADALEAYNKKAIETLKSLYDAQGKVAQSQNLSATVAASGYADSLDKVAQAFGVTGAQLQDFFQSSGLSLEDAAVQYWNTMTTAQKDAVQLAVQAKTDYINAIKDQFNSQMQMIQSLQSAIDQAGSFINSVDKQIAQVKIDTGQMTQMDYFNQSINDSLTKVTQLGAAGAGPNELFGEANNLLQLTMDRYNYEKQQQQDLVTGAKKLSEYARQIGDYAKSLTTSEASPLSMLQKLTAARADFQTTLAQARGGDETAQQALTQKADVYLKLGKDYYASSKGYTDLFGEVQSSLSAFGQSAQSQAEQQLVAAQSSATSANETLLLLQTYKKAAEDYRSQQQKQMDGAIKDIHVLNDILKSLGAGGAIAAALEGLPSALAHQVSGTPMPPGVTGNIQDIIGLAPYVTQAQSGDTAGAVAGAKKAGFNYGQMAWAWDTITGDTLTGGALEDWAKVLGIPAHANGGMAKGLSLVGERGPELIATGPARVFNASETRGILANGPTGQSSDLSVQMAQMNRRLAMMEVHMRETAENTGDALVQRAAIHADAMDKADSSIKATSKVADALQGRSR